MCDFCPNENRKDFGLRNYHGFSGQMCGECYSKIAHDGFNNPKDPKEFLLMVLKHLGRKKNDTSI